MKNFIVGLVAAVMCGSVAKAEFVVVNNPVADTVGFYSDAFNSKGTYTYAQSGAQAFSLEDSYTTSSLRWWGSSNGFNDQGITNFYAFQVVVWNDDFSDQVFSTKISMTNITATPTGDENFFGQPVYEFYVPLAFEEHSGILADQSIRTWWMGFLASASTVDWKHSGWGICSFCSITRSNRSSWHGGSCWPSSPLNSNNPP